jgi:hypothetical protein
MLLAVLRAGAGAILDAIGNASGSIFFGMVLFARVMPTKLVLRKLNPENAVATIKNSAERFPVHASNRNNCPSIP